MLTFHALKFDGEIHYTNPLYVGNYFHLKGMWWKKRKQRQNLILSVAASWYRVTKNNTTFPGFIEEEILLTSLTSQVKDAKVILEKFFTISRIGFNFNNGLKSPTLVRPKKLQQNVINAIKLILDDLVYDPGDEPTDSKLTASMTKIRKHRRDFIKSELMSTGKSHLLPAVNWLLNQENDEIKFYFQPAGRLQARDKSVWPIKSIETWPGWLRTELFGTVVDIENSYLQFLTRALEEKYKNSPSLLNLKYSHLINATNDKTSFRKRICCDVLHLDYTDENIKVVKKIIMSLANGSNISPLMLVNPTGRSEAVNLVMQANPNLTHEQRSNAGKILGFICKQFKAARKDLCIHLHGAKPTRQNQKRIYQSYLEWERVSRYKIWEIAGKTGLMLHDGIDGIYGNVDDLVNKIDSIANLKVTLDHA